MDIYAIFLQSPISSFLLAKYPASLSTGTDSPVKADSSIFKLIVLVRRKSAGTCRPASKQTTSPGTSSFAGISICLPPLFTIAWGLVSFFNASIAFLAFPSCTTPTNAFTVITATIIMASSISPKNKDMAVATKRMKINGSFNCSKNKAIFVFSFFSFSRFSPYCFSRPSASPRLNPFSVSHFKICPTSRTCLFSYILPSVSARLLRITNSAYKFVDAAQTQTCGFHPLLVLCPMLLYACTAGNMIGQIIFA